MKILFDFLPGVFFLVALFFFDIYTATAVVMIAMTIQVAAMLILRKKVSGIQWFTLGIVIVFGAATLLLHDATFIKWKPTVINWMFATTLLIGPVFLKKNFIRLLMHEQVKLPDKAWGKLNLSWAALLFLLGVLNLVVAFNFSERTWGLFKVFGMTGIMFVFILMQAVWIGQHIPSEKSSEP
ncbi:septation protein A [Polaromonas sp.]|uniref:septation protein A n=1 Tax=Polaromonas sp. TaxID=1869339 RepID=UPI003265BBC8